MPRECGNCGNKDCELCNEPREEGGKEFWAKFDLNKWLEDAKEVGEIIRKTMEREKKFIKVNPDDFKNLEWKTTNPDEEAALPKKEDEPIKNGLVGELNGWRVHGKSYDAKGNEIDEKHEKDCACCRKDLFAKKEGEGFDEMCDLIMVSGGRKIELHNFIRQHFINRTAVEKMIEELAIKVPNQNDVVLVWELLEKINKG